jgi:hypothetical protein
VQRLDGWATRSRVYRFVRVWVHDRELDRAVAEMKTDGTHQIAPKPSAARKVKPKQSPLAPPRSPGKRKLSALALVHDRVPGGEARVLEAYEGTLAVLRAAGIPVVAIRYPLGVGPFSGANRALDAVAEKYDLPVVDAAEAVFRVPVEERKWLWGAHPNAAVYAELAKDLIPRVLELTGDDARAAAQSRP